ncbi:MAG TPA: class I SAM-dependent methyltransferase [Methylibium sp.]|uniref:class I SAM-dependent methyltransferase n=1 Tax=Methylibium sp. TaxID=2067992 RepID=UPI002DBFF359|nr:class I SAM-dependent methyltransferase [Methylibium sp.]HEU4458440.1 class I SAM-dependent methyltransferase [Methylibium sp.]
MDTPSGPSCRQCGAAELDDLGPMPSADVFAGQPLEPPWPGGRLYRCRACELGLRHPVAEAAVHERLYATAPEGVWTATELRVDQRLVLDRLEASSGQRVLDVGCYDGTLLAAASDRWEKHGIEASAAAGRRARERGIRIVAPRIRDLGGLGVRYDVICAVDVIEHLHDPRAFVATLAQQLAPGGSLLISTGDFETPAWRRAGGAWWYGSFPEHLSFVSPGWARIVAGQLALELVEAQRFAYATPHDAPLLARRRRRLRRKLLERRLSALLPAALRPASSAKTIGEPGLVVDHVLLHLRRAAPSS